MSTGPSGPVEPWAVVVRHVAILAIASLVSGVLVGGFGGRLVMFLSRVFAQPEAIGRITENGNRIGEFTLGGTITLIIFVGLLGGIVGAVMVVSAEPWASRTGPLHGFVVGVAAMAAAGTTTFESVDFLIIDPLGLNVAMFLALFIGFGYVAVATSRWLDRRVPSATGGWLAIFLIVLSLGSISLLVMFFMFTSPEFCGCEPWHLMGVLTSLLVVAAIALYVGLATPERLAWLSKTAYWTGGVTLAVILAVGVARLVENLNGLS